MKIDVDDKHNIIVKEVYCNFLMETSEGNRIAICMRDDTFEINVLPKGAAVSTWHRVDMQARTIIKDEPCDVVPDDDEIPNSRGDEGQFPCF